MTDERIAELMGWRWPTSVHPDDMLAKVRAVVHEAKTEWQGLTDEELMEILGYGKIERSPTRDFDFVDVIDVKLTRSLINAIEAKLREKNT